MRNYLVTKNSLLVYIFISACLLNCKPPVSNEDFKQEKTADSLVVCFLSDTQEPTIFEWMVLPYNNNALARKMIFEKIIEINPTSVFHLGDIVSNGFIANLWEEVDHFVETLNGADINFYPIPGNHEYLIFPDQGIANFSMRYPYANLTGYSQRIENLAVVLFNSNFDELSTEEKNDQLAWYKQILNDFEADTKVDFVIVGCHHSPFTNSKVVLESREVQELYLPTFYNSSKCKLFISGHTHAYEHFKIHEKDFLVIGGGGGIQQPLLINDDAKYHDYFNINLQKRMFHFLVMKLNKNSLKVSLLMMKNNFEGFDNIPQLIFE